MSSLQYCDISIDRNIVEQQTDKQILLNRNVLLECVLYEVIQKVIQYWYVLIKLLFLLYNIINLPLEDLNNMIC